MRTMLLLCVSVLTFGCGGDAPAAADTGAPPAGVDAGESDDTGGGSAADAASTPDGGAPGSGDKNMGMVVYGDPDPEGNTFACATCHALLEPSPDGVRRPGHSIGDATRRPNFKNGQLSALLDAVNSCRAEWMNAPTWTADSAAYADLTAFLDSMAPDGAAPALAFEIVAPPEQLDGGDAAAGLELFDHSCSVCHGEGAVGTDRAPALAGTQLPGSYIASRVRTSGLTDSPVYEGLTGGKMPFWSADRLSDPELLDLIAWISTSEVPSGDTTGDDTTGGDTTGGDTTGGQECGSTHAKVGMTATLSTFAHGVSGTATIVDDCTIELTQFQFDGNGIDVRLYGAPGGNYQSQGFVLSENLKNFPVGYDNATLTVNIGAHSLDEIDGVSIWCVPVGVSFGDGLFQ